MPSVLRRQRFDTLVGVATIALRDKRASPSAGLLTSPWSVHARD
ncbi:MAG TPA: hypothetical protein VNV17_09270 [Solirubrobacteraceae bacterium]|nr:hypothetical protein [Solirubrobacteraceae bacterium]